MVKKDELIFLGTKDGQKHIIDHNTLDEVMELISPEIFFRANRQYIIHRQTIESMTPHHTGKIELTLKNNLIHESRLAL